MLVVKTGGMWDAVSRIGTVSQPRPVDRTRSSGYGTPPPVDANSHPPCSQIVRVALCLTPSTGSMGFEICSYSLRYSTVTTGLFFVSLRKRSLFRLVRSSSLEAATVSFVLFGLTLFCDPASAPVGRSQNSTLRPPPHNLPFKTPLRCERPALRSLNVSASLRSLRADSHSSALSVASFGRIERHLIVSRFGRARHVHPVKRLKGSTSPTLRRSALLHFATSHLCESTPSGYRLGIGLLLQSFLTVSCRH